jgi:DNA-binding SARP family transcriptional activator
VAVGGQSAGLGDIRIELLGSPHLTVAGREVAIGSYRVWAVLAALAVNAGQVVTMDALTRLVWGDRAPVSPRAALHTFVNRLRGLVGADAVQTAVDGYLLDVPAETVDALRHEQLQIRATELNADAAATTLDEALALWRGKPFSWAGAEALAAEFGPVLAERYLTATERRVDLDLHGGKYDTAITRLQGLLAEYPLRESLWARLIPALRDAGRTTEARQSYEKVRAMLADALGADPSPDLQEVFLSLGPADTADALPDEAPHQLPSGLREFTGRSEQLGWLDCALTDAEARRAGPVVAVVGPGGVGKTSLVLRWAHRVAGRFPDGQLYVNLNGYGAAEPVAARAALDQMLRAVGVPPRRIPADAHEGAGLLRGRLADRRMLVLLDNARDAGQVRPLLPGGGNVTIVTSRSELTGLAVRDGAIRLALPEMTDDEAVELLSRSVGPARAVAEPHAVAELARLCGNLPLALSIAAHQANRYPDDTLAEAVAELRAAADRLDVLHDPGDPSADLRAVFSWSYRALDSDTARVFRYLGLHPAPGISLPAAACSTVWCRSTCWRAVNQVDTGSMTCCAGTRISWLPNRTHRPTSTGPAAGCSTGTCTPWETHTTGCSRRWR